MPFNENCVIHTDLKFNVIWERNLQYKNYLYGQKSQLNQISEKKSTGLHVRFSKIFRYLTKSCFSTLPDSILFNRYLTLNKVISKISCFCISGSYGRVSFQ